MLTGASPKAIRLYENIGLIPSPERRGRYRIYGHKEVELIKIIKEAQQLGFKLSEMHELLANETSCDTFPWDKAIALIDKKQQYFHKEIEKLKNLNVKLNNFREVLIKRKCERDKIA